jgi:acetyltransferase
MHKLIEHFRGRGTQFLVASVLTENRRMLQLAEELGFEHDVVQNEPGVRNIRLALQ